MKKYLLLMRHASHEAALGGQARTRQLSDDGKKEVSEVGDRLASTLASPGEGMGLAKIFHAPSDEARETGAAIQQRLGTEVAMEPEVDLSTDHQDLLRSRDYLREFTRRVLDSSIGKKENKLENAVLLVGHQPMLGWIAYELTGEAHPLARSEILCIEVDHGEGRLRWVVSPRDDQVIKDLREKIKSKMEVAKLLSGFITAGLGFLLASLVDPNRVNALGDGLWAAYLSAGLLFASIGLYLATMYAYDSLLMPSRFWGETPQNARERPSWLVARPPSPVQWILYQNMIRIWSHLFTPATICVLGGLFFLAFAVMTAKAPWPYFECWFWVAGAAIALTCLLGYRGRFRGLTGPWVGSED
jgi:phosphohistidine phosphatase SixA